MEKPPRKKQRVVQPQQYHLLAPQPYLEQLPDSLLLEILSLLDVLSLIRVSRVCKRFHHLYTDEYIWNNTDLTSRFVGRNLDVHELKKIIHDRIPPTLRRVKLSSNRFTKPPVITASLLNDLFNKCSAVKNITLEDCDLTEFPSDCKLYHSDTLERITLTQCEVQFGWMETVRPEWPNLQCLSLAAVISDSDLKYIAGCEAWAKSLWSLNLADRSRYSNISNDGIKAIASALRGNTVLTKLRLYNCRIVAEGISQLAEALCGNTTLRVLDLSHNTVDTEGARHLASALRGNTVLTELRLRNCCIDGEGTSQLAEALCGITTLRVLDLTFNTVDTQGARHLALLLRRTHSLAELWLIYCSIGEDAACQLAEGIRANSTLRSLMMMTGNPLGQKGAQALVDNLAHNTIQLYLPHEYKDTIRSSVVYSRVSTRIHWS